MKNDSVIFKNIKGLSLVELMVAMTISSILMLGIAEIYSINTRSYKVQDENARMQESGRFAFNALMTDIRRAGYFGGNAKVSDITGTTSIATPATDCLTNDTTWGRMIERSYYGLNDTNAGYTGCIPNTDYNQGDILVTRYTKGASVSTTTLTANPNRLYIRNSLFIGRLFIGTDQDDSDNAVSEIPNEVRELAAYAYYVGPSGRNCRFTNSEGSDIPIPSLFREKLSSTGRPQKEEVASGIEHLQLQYGIDSNGDLSANRYFNADDLSNNESVTPNWTEVVSVRFWILVRADCPSSGYTNSKTYSMGDLTGVSAYTPNDSFKRQLYSSTVATRN